MDASSDLEWDHHESSLAASSAVVAGALRVLVHCRSVSALWRHLTGVSYCSGGDDQAENEDQDETRTM